MSAHLAIRRRHIQGKGRTVTLRRQVGKAAPTDVSLLAFIHAYRPDQITEGLKQGDQLAEILNDEIAVASWPGPPKVGDTLIADGKSLAVLGTPTPLYDGPTLLGYTLSVRG